MRWDGRATVSLRAIHRFEEATILAFGWSPDGRQAALVRSTRISDAVLISGFR